MKDTNSIESNESGDAPQNNRNNNSVSLRTTVLLVAGLTILGWALLGSVFWIVYR